MKNPFKQRAMFHADYHDVEQLINAAWPNAAPFELPCDQECSNDVTLTFSVDAKPIDAWEQDELDSFARGASASMMTSSLLDALCRAGILEAGEYAVRVSW